jgi:hypothetical protein
MTAYRRVRFSRAVPTLAERLRSSRRNLVNVSFPPIVAVHLTELKIALE